MATILRDWSYRYQWLYDAIARLAALSVGGETRFRQLALQGLPITPTSHILDLCCGSGQSTRFLVQYSQHVTGLDISPQSIRRAQQNVPQASYVESFAETMPFADDSFDLVHTSVALHEMAPDQLRTILQEAYRVLKPGGYLTLIDLHAPTNPLFWPGLAVFMLLFETETAWQLIRTDLPQLLAELGFQMTGLDTAIASTPQLSAPTLYGGGSIQVIQAKKP